MKLKKIRTLKIDRSKWRTGSESADATGEGDTQLLNDKGFMCCLGFYCNQVGIKRVLLIDAATPGDLPGSILNIPLLIEEYSETTFSLEAIKINDSVSKPAERERNLKSLFKKEGVKVIITGRYKKKYPA